MSFLDTLGKAAHAAAKKSEELVEVAKLNMNVNSEEDKIKKVLLQIGEAVYEKFKTDGTIMQEFSDFCEQIKAHEETIKSLKEKIIEAKSKDDEVKK
jgi:hypothetical protein